MILAEKITKLRKQNGWSQEELAAQLNISRQSVSKWESTASIPDLDKIIKLSELFGVSTDYLLKDELEEDTNAAAVAEPTYESESESESARFISLDDANTYMDLVRRTSKKIAAGVASCILSPILLILLGGLSEYQMIDMTENMASGIGVAALLLIVAGAVAVFIVNGLKLEKYEYLEKEVLSTQYGVAGIVEKKKEEFEPVFKNCTVTGVVICIVCVIPIFAALALDVSDIVYVYCVVVLLALIAFAVLLFVWSGMIYGSYQRLLEEGDYTREKKLNRKRNAGFAQVYWCIVTAVFLGYSFVTGNWDISWVIWPCAGMLFAALYGLAAMLRKK